MKKSESKIVQMEPLDNIAVIYKLEDGSRFISKAPCFLVLRENGETEVMELDFDMAVLDELASNFSSLVVKGVESKKD